MSFKTTNIMLSTTNVTSSSLLAALGNDLGIETIDFEPVETVCYGKNRGGQDWFHSQWADKLRSNKPQDQNNVNGTGRALVWLPAGQNTWDEKPGLWLANTKRVDGTMDWRAYAGLQAFEKLWTGKVWGQKGFYGTAPQGKLDNDQATGRFGFVDSSYVSGSVLLDNGVAVVFTPSCGHMEFEAIEVVPGPVFVSRGIVRQYSSKWWELMAIKDVMTDRAVGIRIGPMGVSSKGEYGQAINEEADRVLTLIGIVDNKVRATFQAAKAFSDHRRAQENKSRKDTADAVSRVLRGEAPESVAIVGATINTVTGEKEVLVPQRGGGTVDLLKVAKGVKRAVWYPDSSLSSFSATRYDPKTTLGEADCVSLAQHLAKHNASIELKSS